MNKYRNKITEVNGIRFHSKKEAKRYQELLLLMHAGEISVLELQKPFKLKVKGTVVAKYIADFVYWKDDERVVEDCKGMRTPLYNLKAKMMKAQYGITILET